MPRGARLGKAAVTAIRSSRWRRARAVDDDTLVVTHGAQTRSRARPASDDADDVPVDVVSDATALIRTARAFRAAGRIRWEELSAAQIAAMPPQAALGRSWRGETRHGRGRAPASRRWGSPSRTARPRLLRRRAVPLACSARAQPSAPSIPAANPAERGQRRHRRNLRRAQFPPADTGRPRERPGGADEGVGVPRRRRARLRRHRDAPRTTCASCTVVTTRVSSSHGAALGRQRELEIRCTGRPCPSARRGHRRRRAATIRSMWPSASGRPRGRVRGAGDRRACASRSAQSTCLPRRARRAARAAAPRRDDSRAARRPLGQRRQARRRRFRRAEVRDAIAQREGKRPRRRRVSSARPSRGGPAYPDSGLVRRATARSRAARRAIRRPRPASVSAMPAASVVGVRIARERGAEPSIREHDDQHTGAERERGRARTGRARRAPAARAHHRKPRQRGAADRRAVAARPSRGATAIATCRRRRQHLPGSSRPVRHAKAGVGDGDDGELVDEASSTHGTGPSAAGECARARAEREEHTARTGHVKK